MRPLISSPSFTVHLTRDELRVVGLALSGKLKSREDLEAARDLNLRLLTEQTSVLKNLLTAAQGALEAARGEAPPKFGSELEVLVTNLVEFARELASSPPDETEIWAKAEAAVRSEAFREGQRDPRTAALFHGISEAVRARLTPRFCMKVNDLFKEFWPSQETGPAV